MADFTDYIPAISLGTQVADMTGKGADGFTAGGYASFVQAVTGSMPSVVPMPGNRNDISICEVALASNIKSYSGRLKSASKQINILWKPLRKN